MNSSNLCPTCNSSVERDAHGGLFVDKCPNCGWESAGTYSPVVAGLRPATVYALKLKVSNGIPSAAALMGLRAASNKAKAMSLSDLRRFFDQGHAFTVDRVADYEMHGLRSALEASGFVVESSVEDESASTEQEREVIAAIEASGFSWQAHTVVNGCITFQDSHGVEFVHIIEDDALYEAALRFLIRHGRTQAV